MRQYLDLLRKIMAEGVTVQTGATLTKEGRQPTARRLHAEQIKFDMADGFPAVTTKPLFWRGVVAEWIWFMRGDPNVSWLRDEQDVHIWDQWADEDGYLGPVYGQQFRKCQGVKWPSRQLPDADTLFRDGDKLLTADPTGALVYYEGGIYRVDDERVSCVQGPLVEVDQIGRARDDIRAVIANPFNRARRRIIVDLWNPTQVDDMALPPCHTLHMYDMVPPSMSRGVVSSGGESHTALSPDCHLPGHPEPGKREACDRWTLNLHLFARSIDAVKGLPFNIASYALMLHVMARITGCKPGTLTITFNDVHIYDNQFADVEEQLQREPRRLPCLFVHSDALLRGIPIFDEVCKDLTIEEAHRLVPGMFRLVGYLPHPKLTSESEIAV